METKSPGITDVTPFPHTFILPTPEYPIGIGSPRRPNADSRVVTIPSVDIFSAVSYTHLDVYKRQPAMWPIEPPAMYPYDMSQRK